MVKTPDGHGRLELTAACAVDDIAAVVAGLRALGAELVGDVERYDDSYRLSYVRRPEGIIVERWSRFAEGSARPSRFVASLAVGGLGDEAVGDQAREYRLPQGLHGGVGSNHHGELLDPARLVELEQVDAVDLLTANGGPEEQDR